MNALGQGAAIGLVFFLAMMAAPALAQSAAPESELAPMPLPSVVGKKSPPVVQPAQSAPEVAPAQAAAEPDEDWGAFPRSAEAPPKTVDALAAEPVRVAPPLPPAFNSSVAQRRLTRPPRLEDFNRVSMYGAPSLGRWSRGLGVYLGFPLLGVRAGIGLTGALDAGLGLDSFYGVMNEVRGYARWQVIQGSSWTGAFAVEGGKAFFTQRPNAEGKGARWLTGRRNYNLLPGFVLSYRGDTPRSARMFVDLRYHLTLDTEPYQPDPLGPSTRPLGHNVPVRMGAEMPFSPKTSFLFVLGFDLHGRTVDSAFMPVCSVGLVTAL